MKEEDNMFEEIAKRIAKTNPKQLWWWMFTAFISGIGLGMYLTEYSQYALWVLIIGLVTHLYVMYKIYAK